MSIKGKKSDQLHVSRSIQLRAFYERKALVLISSWWYRHPFNHLCFHYLFHYPVYNSFQRQNLQDRSDSGGLANLSDFSN